MAGNYLKREKIQGEKSLAAKERERENVGACRRNEFSPPPKDKRTRSIAARPRGISILSMG